MNTPKIAPPMVEVKSSQIHSVGHVGTTLVIKFHSGDTYHYADVHENTYKRMLEAESIGQFFSRHIKPIFDATKQPADDSIEQEIQAKGLTAPRITPADIEANIASEWYFTAAEGAKAGSAAYMLNYTGEFPSPLALLTFCVLVMKNGFTVHGAAACASPENFDAEIGRKIARQQAIDKVWPLMGYELRSKLAAAIEN